MRKSDKIILGVFGLIYTALTVYFVYDIDRDQSASLGYIFVFPIFWLILGIILFSIIKLRKIKPKSIQEKLLVVISTPIPLFIFVFIWFNIPSISETPSSTFEFNKDNHRIREVKYHYSNNNLKRVEYYTSQDSVSIDNPFPENDIWVRDSVWIYYSKNGEIEKKRFFENGTELEKIEN